MERKSNILSIIFVMLLVVTLVSGVTLAVYTWGTINEEEKPIVGNSNCFDIIYVKGNDIGTNEDMMTLSLGSSYRDGLSTTIKMGIDSKCTDIEGVGTLYLNTESDTSDYLINSGLLNYEVLVDNISVNSGIINTKDSIPIYSDFDINYDIKEITVYVWINGKDLNNDNSEQIVNSIYKGNITASAENR